MGHRPVTGDDAGFTLIELLTVVMIIGILATLAVPMFLSQRDKANNGAARSDLRNLVTAQEAHLSGSAETYTADPAALVADGAPLTPGVSHAVCIHDGSGGVGGDAYLAVTVHSTSDLAYVYDSTVGVIDNVTPVAPGADAAQVADGMAICPGAATGF